MRIISWDVGVINLAYCILDRSDKTGSKTKILDWCKINLIENEQIKLKCSGKKMTKKNSKSDKCEKNASFYLKRIKKKYQTEDTNVNTNIRGFCKCHLPQHNKYWSEDLTRGLFSESNKADKICDHVKNTGDVCGKKAKYVFNNDNDGKKQHFCTAHYRPLLARKIKEYNPQPIKNLSVSKYKTSDLQLALIKKLDSIIEHFSSFKIEEIIIENQPSFKNPKMKSIANTLFDYFLIRGLVDGEYFPDLKSVKFICPSNKLKVNKHNTIEVFKANKNNKKKYKLTKQLGIKYTKKLLKNDDKNLSYLNSCKKQDDICDAYLQGMYYLQVVRKPKSVKRSGSKCSKKK